MRTLVFGDIHGCLTAFDHLLDMVKPTPEDTIITLGDYIDRGPDAKGVIDRLLQLDQTHTLIPLRGNHEMMMLGARDNGDLRFWADCGGLPTLESYGCTIQRNEWDMLLQYPTADALERIPAAHWDFVEHRLVDYHETDTHIFVHATLDPQLPLDDQPEFALHWNKLAPTDRAHASGKRIVCGHTKQQSGVPLDLGHTLCIDTWVYGRGYLTCLHLEANHYWQATQTNLHRQGTL